VIENKRLLLKIVLLIQSSLLAITGATEVKIKERPKFVFVFVFGIENDVLCRFRQFRLRPKMVFFIFVFFSFSVKMGYIRP